MPNLRVKPKMIIYRFLGVLIQVGRIKADYIQMVYDNLDHFLWQFWGDVDLMRLIDFVRDESYEDKDACNTSVPIVFKEIQCPKAIIVSSFRDFGFGRFSRTVLFVLQGSISMYILWKCKSSGSPRIGNCRKASNQLIRLVVNYSLLIKRGVITIHDRYSHALSRRSRDKIRQVVLSNITVANLNEGKQLLAYTSQGDLTPYIDCFLSTSLYQPRGKFWSCFQCEINTILQYFRLCRRQIVSSNHQHLPAGAT